MYTDAQVDMSFDSCICLKVHFLVFGLNECYFIHTISFDITVILFQNKMYREKVFLTRNTIFVACSFCVPAHKARCEMGSLLIERICSHGDKFFLFRLDPFLKGNNFLPELYPRKVPLHSHKLIFELCHKNRMHNTQMSCKQ